MNFQIDFLMSELQNSMLYGLIAGMAASGLKPVFAVYSSFLQRGYDQLIHDIAIQNLPVTICIDRAGIVGADGETHQGVGNEDRGYGEPHLRD